MKKFAHHPKELLSRRQFVGLGLLPASSYLFFPSALSLLWGNQAQALSCQTDPGNWIPFLLFDCVGGAGLSGNWLVGKQGGPEDFLKSYDTMGVAKTPQSGQAFDRSLGAPLYTGLSKVREGIFAQTTELTRANLRMGTFCTASQDDSNTNALSPAILISKAGAKGNHIANGVGTLESLSGGNAQSPYINSTLKPLRITTIDDLGRAVSYGTIINKLNPTQRSILARAISRFSGQHLDKLAGLNLHEQFDSLARCGYLKNEQYVVPPSGLDARMNADCKAIYQLEGQTDPKKLVAATIVYNVLSRNTGPGVIAIDGCDYHDGTQTTGDAKDQEIGEHIGRAVELAARFKSPLFFAVVTDGSTYSDKGTRVWRGDSGSKSLAVAGFFDPNRTPEQPRTQVGHFTDGQGVERATYIGNEPKRAAYALLANYLAVNGQLGMFEKLVSSGEFDAKQIDSHLVFS